MANIRVRTPMDIALARTLLRKRMPSNTWSPKFQAAASAAITSFTEVAVSTNTVCGLDIISLSQGSRRGVELRCLMAYSETLEVMLTQVKDQLAPVVNEIKLTHEGGNLRIIARLWRS
jgi:hypothetical protein